MYGLWEKSKRMIWFNAAQIAEINNDTLDYTKLYKTAYCKALPKPESKFDPPAIFEEKLQSFVKEFNVDLNDFINK